jgi:dipeptidyl aminopeptidase/acylaminoacyl peptidase
VKLVCAPSGYVTVAQETSSRTPEKFRKAYFVLSGYLLAARAQRVELRAGAAGKFRLWVNGEKTIDVERDTEPRPFQDEILANAEIREGLNPIHAVVEQASPEPAGLWLRVRDPRGLPVPDLWFVPGDDRAACSPLQLLRLTVESTPVDDGFSLAVRPAWAGIAPRQEHAIPVRVELVRDEGQAPSELASADLEALALRTGKAEVKGAVAFSKAGKYQIRVALGPNREAQTEHTLYYRGDLQRRILRLAENNDGVEKAGLSEGDRSSLVYHIQSLFRALATHEPDAVWLKRRTAEAEAFMAAAGAGKSPYLGKTGVVARAYPSLLDGQPQPYAVYIPPSYKPGGKPFPLVLAMHGLGGRPEIALRTVIGAAPEGGMRTLREARYLPPFPDLGAILAAPWGYGDAGQRHLGEDDVLRVIEQMRAHYHIDDSRISITGASLGGTASFVVPLHYPDLFSAAAPLCGYPNLTRWDSIRNAPHSPWEDILIEKRYIGNYAENGIHLPLYIIHGGKDVPERSQVIADRYRALGYAHTFDVQDDLDHNVWDYGYKDGEMIAWLRARRRPATPSRVRLRTGEYRYHRSSWIRLLGMIDESRFADVDARWLKKEKEIRVVTQNVEAFAVSLKDLSPPEGSRLIVDHTPFDLAGASGAVFVVHSKDGWQIAPEEPSRLGRKRPGVSGPLDDIERHPLLIVYGTQDDTQVEANRMVAAHFASGPYATDYPVKADMDVSPEDLQKTSLMIIGGPSTNQVAKTLVADLPVHFEPSAIVFRGRRYEGEDVGISMIYPHPRNPAEYIVLHAGTGYKGTLASRHLPRFAPDYLIYDSRMTAQRGKYLLDRRPVLEGGYFDSYWR